MVSILGGLAYHLFNLLTNNKIKYNMNRIQSFTENKNSAHDLLVNNMTELENLIEKFIEAARAKQDTFEFNGNTVHTYSIKYYIQHLLHYMSKEGTTIL